MLPADEAGEDWDMAERKEGKDRMRDREEKRVNSVGRE